MTINQAVAEALDETIQALTRMDLKRLQRLEERIAAFADSGAKCSGEGLHLILAKKRLLKLILQSSEANLKALNRLHGRNTSDQWAH